MGGRVRNLAILTALSGAFDLTMVTLVHERPLLRDPGPVADLGEWIPVLAPNRRSPLHRAIGQLAYRSLGRRWTREAWFLGTAAVAEVVERRIAENPPDLVHSAYWFTLRHLKARPRPPLWILDTHDVQFERWEKLGVPLSPEEKRAEIAELQRNDLVIAITPRDADTFRRVTGGGARIETIGMGVDIEEWSRKGIGAGARGTTVVYYGNMAGEANRRAAAHLCRDILPELRRIRPGVEVMILGADPAEDVLELREIDGVTVTGTVEDPRIHLARCGVFALPFRAASGIRSRACEAMALGVPIVAYPETLAGMGFQADRDYLEADDPAGFARQLARVLEDPARADAIAASARREVERRYSIASTYGRFVELYERLIAESAAARSMGRR